MARKSAKKKSPPNFNVSYLPPELPRATSRQALRHYIAAAVIYGAAVLILSVSPYFRDLLRVQFRGTPAAVFYRYAYVAYLVIGAMVFFILRPRSLWVSKPLYIVGYFNRLFRWLLMPAKSRPAKQWRPTYQEKHALIFMCIRIFYGPLAIHYVIAGYNEIVPQFKLFLVQMSFLNCCDRAYVLLISVVFFLDAFTFLMGYHTESGLLRNKLRYVETNPFHILVCIVCYPPFNMATVAFLGPSNRDPYLFWAGDINHPMTWVLRGLAAFFLVILAASSLALFTKASNLTNRGIVQWGPYRIVRHPGYIAKNLYWFTTLIPAFIPNTADQRFTWSAYLLFCLISLWSIIGWGTIYFLRSITEERLLLKDPDYVAYCKKVKYRFIPGVY